MKSYLNHSFNTDDIELASVLDELPLWSAPFGLSILDAVRLTKNIKVLDIGSGTGFPLIELAQRLGESCRVYGIDPWETINYRARMKVDKYNLTNVKVITGYAEELPFETGFFDLVVSNNGINNAADMGNVLVECGRVCRSGAQFVFTVNLEDTMIEFYDAFRSVLNEMGFNSEIEMISAQIYSKRKPLSEVEALVSSAGFKIEEIKEEKFNLRFADAAAMFNHSLIKYWFLPGWKALLNPNNQDGIFNNIEKKMNSVAADRGGIKLSVPFVTVDCTRE